VQVRSLVYLAHAGCPVLAGCARAGNLTLIFSTFNDLRFHSNANKKVIDKQCTFVLFSCVFAATQPRTVLTSLPNACTPPRESNSHRNVFRINTCKSLSKQTTLTAIESHSYKKHGEWACYAHPTKDAHPESANGGGVEGFFSRPALRSLFAQRAFHNSLGIKSFHTLSGNCRVCTNNSHSGTRRSSFPNERLSIRAGNRNAKECTIRSFLKAKGDPCSRGRKSCSAKHLVGARGLVRLCPLVPRAGQLLDLSFWARPRALDGSDARVLWKAPHRRNSHALGDVWIAAHYSLFAYAPSASSAFVRAGCKVLDDRERTLVHPLGSIHRLGGFGHLRQFVPVNRPQWRGMDNTKIPVERPLASL